MVTAQRVVLAAAALAIAAAGCVRTAGGKAPAASSPFRLRLMSYNVQHCEGPEKKFDLAPVAAAIARARPDFVGINEIHSKTRRTGNVDQPAELGLMTGLCATFGQGMPYQGGGYGVAVLSRETPISVLRVPLPGGEPRVLLLCEFAGFWFGTTHLDFGEHQLRAVEIIRGVVAEKAATKPVFLTGDWNATPKSRTLDAMRGFMEVISKENCRTFHGRKEHPPESEYCIDYVAIDSAHAANVRVKESYVTSDAVTSDHNPVVVELELVGR